MCQPVQATFIDAVCVPLCVATSSLHRRRQSVTVHVALLSLGRQLEMRYLHHYATTNSLPCRFVASWTLNYILEHIIHNSTLVTVFTVRVGEHNFIVLTHSSKLLIFEKKLRFCMLATRSKMADLSQTDRQTDKQMDSPNALRSTLSLSRTA